MCSAPSLLMVKPYGTPLLLLFALLCWVTNATTHLVNYPDPTSFPEELRRHYVNLDGKYNCNFNKKTACMFKSTDGWNFHQSLRELAEQLRRAAEAAAFAVSETVADGTGQNQTVDMDTNDLRNIVVPTANFFPCYAPARTFLSDGGFPKPESSKLELYIPWPHFARLVVPVAVVNPSASSRVVGPPAMLNPYAQSQQQSREESIYQVLPVQSPSTLLACVHFKLRFPANRSSQVNVSFIELLQTVTTGPTNVLTPASYRRGPTTYFDWSIFHQPSVANPQSAQSIPLDVWIELSVPIDVRTSIISELQSNPEHTETPITFSSNGATWIVHILPTVLRIETTRNVCLDDFQLRPLIRQLTSETKDNTNTCVRSLSWIDPETERKRILLVDEFGVPLRPTDSAFARETRSQRPSLYMADNRTSFGSISWLHFAGSLILAVSTTVLFLLFVSAVGLSIVLAHKRKPGCRIRRYSPIHPSKTSDSPSSPLAPSILSESVCPVKYDYGAPTVDTEPNSTQCGESLFLNGTDTYRSDREPQSGMSETNIEAVNTSAVQLMRNWYFYRRRGNRARQHLSQRGISPGGLPAFQPPVSTHPLNFGRTELNIRPTNHNQIAQNRQSLVLSTDSNNQLVILPAFQSDSAPSTNMRSASSFSSDAQLFMIPETPPSRRQSTTVDAEATRLELAESVRRLEEYFSQSNQADTSELGYPHCNSSTPATVARSQLTSDRNYASSSKSVSSHSSSPLDGPSGMA